MYNEARKRPEEATAWYDKILEDGSADLATLRRQVAAVKGEEGPTAAAAKLVKHLEVFQNDLIAWEELAELYVQVCTFLSAAQNPPLVVAPRRWRRRQQAPSPLFCCRNVANRAAGRACTTVHLTTAALLAGGGASAGSILLRGAVVT